MNTITVEICVGDLTKQRVGAIVNPTNKKKINPKKHLVINNQK